MPEYGKEMQPDISPEEYLKEITTTEEAYKHLTLQGTVGCERHPIKGTPPYLALPLETQKLLDTLPFKGRPVYACKHVAYFFPENLESIVKIPPGYYICSSCFTRIERKRFRFPYELTVQCEQCIVDRIVKNMLKNPKLFRDLTIGQ